MLIGILWIAFAIAVGLLASKRGRGSGNWFLVSLLVSPLLGVIFLLAMEDLSGSSDATHVKCPACAEQILRDATKCKHCGADVAPQPYKGSEAERSDSTRQVLFLISVAIGICVIFAAAFLR